MTDEFDPFNMNKVTRLEARIAELEAEARKWERLYGWVDAHNCFYPAAPGRETPPFPNCTPVYIHTAGYAICEARGTCR